MDGDRGHAARIAMGSAAVKDARYARAARRRPLAVLDRACAHREELAARVARLPGAAELIQTHHAGRPVAPRNSIIRLA